MTTARAVLRRLRLVISIVIFVSAWDAMSAAQPTFATKRVINSFVNGLLPFDVRAEDIDRDGDLDGMRGALDCAPAAGSGTGARHDVMQGLLSELPPASRSGETCQ